jgi:hypothetical protein
MDTIRNLIASPNQLIRFIHRLSMSRIWGWILVDLALFLTRSTLPYQHLNNALRPYFGPTLRSILQRTQSSDDSLLSLMIHSILDNLLITFVSIQLFNDIESRLLIPIVPSLIRWWPVQTILLLCAGSYWHQQVALCFYCITSLPPWWTVFLVLFIFKFLKVVVHTVSYIQYQPTPLPDNPTLRPEDVTVIIPTVGNFDEEFQECVRTILANKPHELIISTVGATSLEHARSICDQISPKIRCVAVIRSSKRNQILEAVQTVSTRITCLADDHVFWPPTYLQSTLACFEDPQVGHVGTVKRVRRRQAPVSPADATFPELWESLNEDFRNYIACMYLERHNFECTASSNIDGGCFVISGRTAFLRTSIIQEPHFQNSFRNEFWGAKGPMNVDDDNFITRYMVKHGFKIVFHNTQSALMSTTLGESGGWTKFRGQLYRWARTTWRSNYTTLIVDKTAWHSQQWCVYAVYFSAFVNLALVYDPLLFLTLHKSPYGTKDNMWTLAAILFTSKLIKPFPHWWRNPHDLKYLLLGIGFGYFHSLVKLYTLLTVNDISWGTRAGVDIDTVDEQVDQKAAAELAEVHKKTARRSDGREVPEEGKSELERKEEFRRRLRSVANTSERLLNEVGWHISREEERRERQSRFIFQ